MTKNFSARSRKKKRIRCSASEIEAIKKNPFKEIDPKKKDQLVTNRYGNCPSPKAKEDEKQGKTIQGEVVKMKADLAKMMKIWKRRKKNGN